METPMTFDEYQKFTETTAIYDPADALAYTTCGLVGEACEYAAKVQKIAEKAYTDIQKKYIDEKSDKVRDGLLTQMDTLRRLNSVLLEAGSLVTRAETLKKDIRSKRVQLPSLPMPTAEQAKDLAKEISDVGWYFAQTAKAIGYKLSKIVEVNVDKLTSRKERGVLDGNGDNR